MSKLPDKSTRRPLRTLRTLLKLPTLPPPRTPPSVQTLPKLQGQDRRIEAAATRRPTADAPYHHQRGAAALVVTLMLFLALALALVCANRTLLVDTRTTRYQVRASQAFEAAEAGVEWTTAKLNDPRGLDDTCQASPLASTVDLRNKLLAFDASSGFFLPHTWLDAGTAQALQVACVRGVEGWQCSCPSSGAPHPFAPSSTSRPSFVVSLQAGTSPGTVQVTAIGCNNSGPSCIAGSGEPVEGKAQVQTLLALLPALYMPPIAPLTARGDVEVPNASIGLVNGDPASGGSTVDAGGTFTAPHARLTSAAGAAATLSVIEGDSALHALGADALFARHFGMDKATWRQRPGVSHVACASSCGASIEAAVAAGASLIWVDGDLATDSAAAWGSPTHPVVVIATGDIVISGKVTMTGVLYGQSLAWNDAGADTAAVRGAVISETGYVGDAPVSLTYDSAILHKLNVDTGTFVRVPGSWKDF